MHIIIKEFIETGGRLFPILEKYYDKEQFLEAVFLDLLGVINNEDIDQQMYLDVDLAIIKGHPDTNLYLLFISYAISLTARHEKLERANAIQSIGLSLPREKIHPVIFSFYIQKMADIKFYEGKTVEYKALLKESISIIDRKWPRYLTILANMGTLISWEGRLKELDKEDLDLFDAPTNENLKMACLQAKLANAVFTGSTQESQSLLKEHRSNFLEFSQSFLQGCTDLISILLGNFDENCYHEEFFKVYSKICNLLAEGRREEAKPLSELLQNKKWGKKFSQNFAKYTSLHIELCLRNKGKSRLILQEIQQRDSVHYLDDFFLARIQLLELNREGANETFSRLIENVNRYDAMGRLVFELQFAKEMKSSDILLLMNGINFKNSLKRSAIKEEQPVILSPVEKGIKLLVGDSSVITQVKKLVKKFAKLKEPILITGETGTGKELFSRAIHDEGLHPNEPFLAINCGALTESLLQSELFGYEAGAFTGAQKERQGIFEAAGKGTVFLDEFGDISQKLQTSLLRVLESNEIRLIGGTKTRQIECKIVIATNIDLQQAVEEKKFREDLYFRLARFDIKLPPLRERPEDILSLINHFLEGNLKSNQKKVSNELLNALTKYRWPGNIRELKNEMERLKILHPDKAILNVEDFDFSRLQGGQSFNPLKESKTQTVNLESPIKPTIKNERIVNDRILKIVQKTSTVEQRHEFLKELFQQYKKLSRSQIMEIADISPVTATKDLQMLCAIGFIERRTPTKSVKSHYFVLVE